MPSVNCLSPRGKLYSKVCNIICKRRELGGKVKKSTDIGISAENLAAWESLEEGYNTANNGDDDDDDDDHVVAAAAT